MMELLSELYKYKHVSFDLWLTLIKSNPEFKPRRNVLFREFFGIGKPLEEVSAAIRKFDILTNSVNEKVGRNFNTFEIYYLILDALGVDIETVTAAQLQEYYNLTEALLLEHKPLLLDGAIPQTLEKLRANGQTLNILSNTAFIKGQSLRTVLAHYGLGNHFTFQAYSDETGYSKPACEMYEHAYTHISRLHTGIEKHEVLHVGDNVVSDYNGARAFGFSALLITNNATHEPKLQPA